MSSSGRRPKPCKWCAGVHDSESCFSERLNQPICHTWRFVHEKLGKLASDCGHVGPVCARCRKCAECVLTSEADVKKHRQKMHQRELKRLGRKEPKAARQPTPSDQYLSRDAWQVVMSKLSLRECLRLSSACRELRRIGRDYCRRMLLMRFQIRFVTDDSSRLFATLAACLSPESVLFVESDGILTYHYSGLFDRNGLCLGGLEKMVLRVVDDSFRNFFRREAELRIPSFVDELAARFRSGECVFYDSSLRDAITALLPRSWYHITRRVGVFERKCAGDRMVDVREARLKENCYDEMIQRPDGMDDEEYFCEELMLAVMPMHSVGAERVGYYEERFLSDPEYKPTILLLSPTFRAYGDFEERVSKKKPERSVCFFIIQKSGTNCFLWSCRHHSRRPSQAGCSCKARARRAVDLGRPAIERTRASRSLSRVLHEF